MEMKWILLNTIPLNDHKKVHVSGAIYIVYHLNEN